MTDHSFSLDMEAIRQQARRDMRAGAVTDSYGTDPKAVIDVLNDVLATEIVCWMRYSQLGGEPDFDPRTMATRAHTTYETTDDSDLVGMLRENLVAERIVITTYQEIIRWLGDSDVTTRRMLESILAEEEEHADDILNLLGDLKGSQ
jgi:bacterioferritin